MPRIKTGGGKSKVKSGNSWQKTIMRRIKDGKVVPLVSNVVGNNLVLGGDNDLIEQYAAHIGYPLERKRMPQMAQFKSVTDDKINDSWEVNSDYVNFIKNRLFDIAIADGVSQDVLDELEEEFDDVNFSDFCQRLGYPRFDNVHQNPLLILADLPLPVYVTTSYHNFLEAALKRAGLQPRTEICRWHEGLKSIPSVFDDPTYQPSSKEPLVYHLHGLDTHPESLVLTEDDYMEFLVAISRDQGKDTDVIHRRVREAMADSSLILLGYSLEDWDFRTLFWALIKPRPKQPLSVSIQLAPEEEEKHFLKKYLKMSKFKVYWGDTSQNVRELLAQMEG